MLLTKECPTFAAPVAVAATMPVPAASLLDLKSIQSLNCIFPFTLEKDGIIP